MVVVVAMVVLVESGTARGCELLHAGARSIKDPKNRNTPVYRKGVKGDDLGMPQRMAVRPSHRATARRPEVPECLKWVIRVIGRGELLGGSGADVKPAGQGRVVGGRVARDVRRPRLFRLRQVTERSHPLYKDPAAAR